MSNKNTTVWGVLRRIWNIAGAAGVGAAIGSLFGHGGILIGLVGGVALEMMRRSSDGSEAPKGHSDSSDYWQ